MKYRMTELPIFRAGTAIQPTAKVLHTESFIFQQDVTEEKMEKIKKESLWEDRRQSTLQTFCPVTHIKQASPQKILKEN
jgi:hypothetical protein